MKRKTITNISSSSKRPKKSTVEEQQQQTPENEVAQYSQGDEPYRKISEISQYVALQPDVKKESVEIIRNQQKKFYDAYRVGIVDEENRKNAGNGSSGKTISKRPDLQAMQKFTKENNGKYNLLYHDFRIFGHIPGIQINDKFSSRAEMKVLGLHSKHLSGIDTVPPENAEKQKIFLDGELLKPAVAIVVSGSYEDNISQENYRMEYTGEGGNNLLGNKKQIKDQEFSKGNKGLVHSFRLGSPIRVFWKQDDKNSLYGTVFLYDGLWTVRGWKYYQGTEGFKVFRFSLERMPNQLPPLAQAVGFKSLTGASVGNRKLSALATYSEHLICTDLSRGKEVVPITVSNDKDNDVPPGFDPKFIPNDISEDKKQKILKKFETLEESQNFTYITESIRAENVETPRNPDEKKLLKQFKIKKNNNCDGHELIEYMNRGVLPYIKKGKHIILRDFEHQVVYECGTWNGSCFEGADCAQRGIRQGSRARLELYKTNNRGWGVRTLDPIAAGEYVISYLGKIMTLEDSEKVDKEYQFDLTPPKIAGLREFRCLDGKVFKQKFIVDAKHFGNVSRFINHSCEPNLYSQPIVNTHLEETQLEVALFARKNINAWDEINIDYGIDYIKINLKNKCLCGTPFCFSNNGE